MQTASFLNPLLLSFYIPNLTAFASRFIIQSMVEDKANKMRESLRLMSLDKMGYALSFVLFQSIYAIVSSIIMGLFVYNNNVLFPNHT